MRFIVLFAAFVLAVSCDGGLPNSGTSFGYTNYNASSVTACLSKNGGCSITDQYSASSQNAVIFTGHVNNSYQVSLNFISKIGNLNISHSMYNDAMLNPASSFLHFVMNKGFSANEINIGYYASVGTTGSPLQNSLQIIVTSLYSLGSINSAAYQLKINSVATLTGGSLTVGTLYTMGTATFNSLTINAAVGFQNNAAATFTRTSVYANQIWLAQNAASNAFATCNGGVIQTTAQLKINGPQMITNCNLRVGSDLIVIPAPPSSKREGSTDDTVFNNGTSDANKAVQPGKYDNNPLFRKREMKRMVQASAPNPILLINGHQMTIASGITQTGGASTTLTPDCTCVLTCNFASNKSQIQAECPGCYFNPSCSGSIVAGSASTKRCDGPAVVRPHG